MAVMLQILPEWEEAPGIADPADAAAWARLQITLEGPARVILTRVLDRRASTTRDGVYGSVVPLAAWIARSWSHLFRSGREPPRIAESGERYRWERTHSWRHAGEGIALPDVRFSPVAEQLVALEIQPDGPRTPAYERVEFLTPPQEVEIPREELKRSFRDFVDRVLSRLEATAPSACGTAELVEIWRRVQDRGAPDHDAEVLSARLGLLWDTMEESDKERVRGLSRQLETPLDALVADGATVGSLPELLRSSQAAWEKCESSAGAHARWRELWTDLKRDWTPAASMPAWELGWQAAKLYRKSVGAPAAAGATEELLVPFAMGHFSWKAPGDLEGIAWERGHTPVRLEAQTRPFAKARDLYVALFGPGPDRRHAAVFSRQFSRATPVANAFAAELLAPVELVSSRIHGAAVSVWDIQGIAQTIGAPEDCVFHQIRNHQLAEIDLPR